MRAERAVEPTRSENITVTWRRSAAPSSARDATAGGGAGTGAAAAGRAIELGDRAQQLPPMTQRGHPEFFQVLVRQIGQDGKIDVVLAKALGVLAETELLEPLRNLLHSGPHRRLTRSRDQRREKVLSEKLLRREKKSRGNPRVRH